MRKHLAGKVLTLITLLAQSFSLSPVTFSQERVREDTRPRRTQTSSPQSNSEWRAPVNETPASVIESAVLAPGPEPQIRIALGIESDIPGGQHH